MSKSEQLIALYESYKREFEDKEIVLGDGNPDGELLLIGEAPGKDEVLKGRPFVGMAGKNLSEFLDVIKLTRDDIYITNAIKFRLSKVNPDTGRISNRPATRQEIEQNRDYLLKEISIIEPKYIITLGNVPLRAVYGDFHASIGTMHGEVRQTEIDSRMCNVFALYHPASVIYNASLKTVYQEDLNKLNSIIR